MEETHQMIHFVVVKSLDKTKTKLLMMYSTSASFVKVELGSVLENLNSTTFEFSIKYGGSMNVLNCILKFTLNMH